MDGFVLIWFEGCKYLKDFVCFFWWKDYKDFCGGFWGLVIIFLRLEKGYSVLLGYG